MKVWLNGVLDGVENLRISPLDHGLLTGDGVFETLRVYGGTPFAWSRHYARLMDSASGLDLDVPPDEELRDAAKAVIDANEILEARLRITITGGEAPLGSERSDARHTVIVAASQVDVAPINNGCRYRALGTQRKGGDLRNKNNLVWGKRQGPRIRPSTRSWRGHIR